MNRCLLLAVFMTLSMPSLWAVGYEVWITDQNNTAGFTAQNPRGTHGGRLIIWDGRDLDNSSGAVVDRPEIIDLAQMYANGGPNNNTGAEVSRPHMLAVSANQKYMVLAFVASGHVAIIDSATRRSKALFRMSPGAGGAIQAHAAQWTMDGKAILIANQNGKLFERINYDKVTDSFMHDRAATLNLATCRTPNGLPCQTATPVNEDDPNYFGAHNRPDNAPICPVVTFNNKAIITLRGGGILVADPTTTPMTIVAEYGNLYYGRDGCGGVQIGNRVFLNAGVGTLTTNHTGYNLYEIEDRFPSAPTYLPANDEMIRPRHFAGHDAPERDAHGIVAGAGGYYLYSFDRLANVAEVHRAGDLAHVRSIPLGGPLSADPTPDIAYLAPTGDRIFLALRGPRPQTGAHASAGTTPGLGVFTLTEAGTWGSITAIGRTSFRNPIDGGEESDPHTVIVRLK
jgi:hypothetical protein